jgi:hypothetical protein
MQRLLPVGAASLAHFRFHEAAVQFGDVNWHERRLCRVLRS